MWDLSWKARSNSGNYKDWQCGCWLISNNFRVSSSELDRILPLLSSFQSNDFQRRTSVMAESKIRESDLPILIAAIQNLVGPLQVC